MPLLLSHVYTRQLYVIADIDILLHACFTIVARCRFTQIITFITITPHVIRYYWSLSRKDSYDITPFSYAITPLAVLLLLLDYASPQPSRHYATPLRPSPMPHFHRYRLPFILRHATPLRSPRTPLRHHVTLIVTVDHRLSCRASLVITITEPLPGIAGLPPPFHLL